MPRTTPTTDRRAAMLDGAVDLVAAGGLQALTHRSVEAAAGLPHGSVTYHFGGRDGLVDALVERLVTECETQVDGIARDVSRALATGDPSRAEAAPDSVADALIAWIDDQREVHLARLELELAAARDPALRVRMTDAARSFWRMCEPIVVALGSVDPATDGRAMAVTVDGILLDRLSHDDDRGVVVAVVRQVLRPWRPLPPQA